LFCLNLVLLKTAAKPYSGRLRPYPYREERTADLKTPNPNIDLYHPWGFSVNAAMHQMRCFWREMRGINLFRSGNTAAFQVINVPQIDFALASAHRKVNRLAQLLISAKHLERPLDLVAVRPLKIRHQAELRHAASNSWLSASFDFFTFRPSI